jgi:hypothetical protein
MQKGPLLKSKGAINRLRGWKGASTNRLDIQASVDLEGLKKLRTMLEKYQGILEMMQTDIFE